SAAHTIGAASPPLTKYGATSTVSLDAMWWLDQLRKNAGVANGARGSGAGISNTSDMPTASSHVAAGRGARCLARAITTAITTATASQTKTVKRPGRTC